MGTQTFDAAIADVTIANAQTTSSRVVDGKYEYSDATAIVIYSPATLPETVNIEVSYDGTTFDVLHDGTNNITCPAAGKARQYVELLGTKAFRLVATGAVGGDRTFKITKQWSA